MQFPVIRRFRKPAEAFLSAVLVCIVMVSPTCCWAAVEIFSASQPVLDKSAPAYIYSDLMKVSLKADLGQIDDRFQSMHSKTGLPAEDYSDANLQQLARDIAALLPQPASTQVPDAGKCKKPRVTGKGDIEAQPPSQLALKDLRLHEQLKFLSNCSRASMVRASPSARGTKPRCYDARN